MWKATTDADVGTLLAEKGLDDHSALWQERFEAVTASDVERALSEQVGSYSLPKLLALTSPAAENYLEEMAQLAHALTVQRFGRTIRLYAPLYLSNYCINSCRYCGFNRENEFNRTRLSIDEAVKEAGIIAAEGFKDILLVSSEDRQFVNVDYLVELAGRLRDQFSSISIEVYQMSWNEYARLFEAGINGVTLYQETYDRRAYGYYHPAGPKADYDFRLSAPEKFAGAEMREVGLGVLLGLTDWRLETLALAEHAHYLIKRYWQSHVSFSFPRLRPAFGVRRSEFNVSSSEFRRTQPSTYLLGCARVQCSDGPLQPDVVNNERYRADKCWVSFSDKNLVQMITALRLCFADVGLVLSTRERAELRDHLIRLGVTKLSAGSRTSPGGYSGRTPASLDASRGGGQFEIDDRRTPAQVASMIKQHGFEPVWKDWDNAFSQIQND